MADPLDIVVVNWNAGPQLRTCVTSVLEYGSGALEKIVVVDNGSTDGSEDAVEELPDVEIIRSGENLGFAAACNLGAANGTAPYILFLNPDTRVNVESLSAPLAFMERSENVEIGVCGVQLVDENRCVSRTCARFPTLGRIIASALGVDKLPGLKGAGVHMRDWAHESSRRVDHVIGAFYLIRRSVFEGARGFDQRFFVYLEDVDLSVRVKKAGWEIWYIADAQAFHAGGGTSHQVKAHRLFYSLRSRLLYGFKHFSQWQAWVLLGVTGLLEPFTRIAYCLARGDGAGVRNTWSAYRMLWRGMGRIVRGQGRFQP